MDVGFMQQCRRWPLCRDAPCYNFLVGKAPAKFLFISAPQYIWDRWKGCRCGSVRPCNVGIRSGQEVWCRRYYDYKASYLIRCLMQLCCNCITSASACASGMRLRCTAASVTKWVPTTGTGIVRYGYWHSPHPLFIWQTNLAGVHTNLHR
jgi:hypothetical protein